MGPQKILSPSLKLAGLSLFILFSGHPAQAKKYEPHQPEDCLVRYIQVESGLSPREGHAEITALIKGRLVFPRRERPLRVLVASPAEEKRLPVEDDGSFSTSIRLPPAQDFEEATITISLSNYTDLDRQAFLAGHPVVSWSPFRVRLHLTRKGKSLIVRRADYFPTESPTGPEPGAPEMLSFFFVAKPELPTITLKRETLRSERNLGIRREAAAAERTRLAAARTPAAPSQTRARRAPTPGTRSVKPATAPAQPQSPSARSDEQAATKPSGQGGHAIAGILSMGLLVLIIAALLLTRFIRAPEYPSRWALWPKRKKNRPYGA